MSGNAAFQTCNDLFTCALCDDPLSLQVWHRLDPAGFECMYSLEIKVEEYSYPAQHPMVWPLSSCLYLTPPPVIHDFTRLPTFVLTTKCILAGLSTSDGELFACWSFYDHHVRVWDAQTGQVVCKLSVSSADGIALSPTLIESSSADRLIAPWHRYGDTICIFDVYRLSEMWVKDTQTWR